MNTQTETQTATAAYAVIDSPLGRLVLLSDGRALTGIHLLKAGETFEPPKGSIEDSEAAPLPEARRQLESYFQGDLRAFDLPLNVEGTKFQRRVWEELRRIPYGETISYGELARRVGNPNASRAVGLANGRNPLMIVVPCHRVIGASGKLTGFSAGLGAKEKLLALERTDCLALL
jgi:methylated-DNA-[protein]-cysteine S-methyltransferase